MLKPLLVLTSLLGLPALSWAQVAMRETEGGLPAAAPAASSLPAAPVVYYTAEQMPAFPGGPEAFQKFLRTKLQYPDEALRQGVSGKVYVRFLVTEEGRICDAAVVKGLGFGLDQEALRLVRIMPWWTPAHTGGLPVRVLYTLPIVFRALD